VADVTLAIYSDKPGSYLPQGKWLTYVTADIIDPIIQLFIPTTAFRLLDTPSTVPVGMTLTQLQNYVRNYTLERAGDVGLITDAELIDIINAASRMIWVRIATKYPDVFATRTASNLTVTAGQPVPFSTVASPGHQIYKIILVAAGPVGATLSQLDPLNSYDRQTYRQVYEPMPSTQVLPTRPFRWYVEAENIYFTPAITSGNFDVRVSYIPMPNDLVSGTDNLWGSLLPQYHDWVAVLAAVMVYGKDGHLQNGYTPIFQYIDNILVEHFGPPSNPYAESPKEYRP